jgi:hypothetical protein
MTQAKSSNTSLQPHLPLVQFRVWHLGLLSLFVAIAIVNIQDQRQADPTLIALAAVGFALYGLIGWAAWCLMRRLRSRLGKFPVLALYLLAMAGLFLAATIIYLLIEHAYLFGL